MSRKRRKNERGLIAAIFAVAALCGCNRVPGYVIQPEEMAQLMADVRVADAVVNVNSSDWRNPASREALRQAVFNRHGVTEADYDTSLVWYGHNITRYQEVTDRSIEILQERLNVAGSAAAAAAMSVAGDSVDVWDAPRLYTFNAMSPTDYLTFALEPDRNWQEGDVYSWHVRFVLPPENAQWSITAEYDDGVIEVINQTIHSTTPGRQTITFYTDSTRSARHISGRLEIGLPERRPVVIDSVGLLRRRRHERQGYSIQRRYIPKKTADADSVSSR